ncbi:MAG TPA: ArsA-related P-loop ATPase [Candidatus Binatia bacterium]|jgi:anion-transporting  ArsA/GET3 family ATPase
MIEREERDEREARGERNAKNAGIDEVLARHRVVVCVGSGGVGKTTIAAALALVGALAGRRTMVLTIDPARRLAEALGAGELRPGGERIEPRRFEQAGLDPSATLWAGMLDQKSAWDEFIARHSPNPQVRDTILANPFYQNVSRSFAGSTEYMAIEELCRIEESGNFDLIVLDTPPSRHALDFLEAPRRLEDLFDRTLLSWLAGPASAGWSAWKAASRGARFVFERIEDATGIQALSEIASFFSAIESLVDGVTARSRKVRALLQDPSTAFVLVTGPDEQVLEDAEGLTERMQQLGVSLKGVVMNRLQVADGIEDPRRFVRQRGASSHDRLDDRVPDAGDDPLAPLMAALAAQGVAPAVVRWLRGTLEARIVQAAAQEVRREVFEAELPEGISLRVVPEQSRDVHDLAGLAAIARELSRADAC